MSPEEIETFLMERAARNEQSIKDAIQKLENRIIDLSSGIDTRRDGSILPPSKTLSQTRKLHKESTAAFNEIYMTAVDSTLDYSDVDSVIQDYLGIRYSGVTKSTLTALIVNDRAFHDSLSSLTQDSLNASVIDHVINGKSKNNLTNSIRFILTGLKDAAGRPMESHAGTIAQDSLMGYYSTANLMSADAAGVSSFKFFGSLIKDSRQWCADHVGKTFTREEIDEFDDDKWAGKKPGSTIIHRGGYNCRHSWLPIIE